MKSVFYLGESCVERLKKKDDLDLIYAWDAPATNKPYKVTCIIEKVNPKSIRQRISERWDKIKKGFKYACA